MSDSKDSTEKACFGAGCYWGTEKFFRKQFKGIKKGAVGFMGGNLKDPSYEQVCKQNNVDPKSDRHAEVFYMEYDPTQAKYADMVEWFFRFHDPTTKNKQGNDTGPQYRSVIFYYSDDQKKAAQEVLERVEKEHYSSSKIITEIVPAGDFWSAEDYHQKYLERNPGGYCNHRLRW